MPQTQTLYHIVIATLNLEPCLVGANRLQMYNAISHDLDEKQCRLYRINAGNEHIHILCSLHPSISLDDLVSSIKKSSTMIIQTEKLFPDFTGWREDYGAFTGSYKDKVAMSKYVEQQHEFHREVSFKDEFAAMLKTSGIQACHRVVTPFRQPVVKSE